MATYKNFGEPDVEQEMLATLWRRCWLQATPSSTALLSATPYHPTIMYVYLIYELAENKMKTDGGVLTRPVIS